VDITFAEAAAPKNTRSQTTNTSAPKLQTETQSQEKETFDYPVELQKLALEVETTLQAKFDKVFAKMQQSLDNIELKMEAKIQCHMDQLQATQVDRATQDNHSKQLGALTKMLNILVRQMNTLLDQKIDPTPMNGVGES